MSVGKGDAILAGPDEPAKPVDFNRDILPILSDTCFACHGPDDGQRTANFRLDTEEGMFADRGGYRLVVPGSSAQSKLYQKITATDAAVRMPPASSSSSLTSAQIDLIKRWIDEGAPYAKHWSYVCDHREKCFAVWMAGGGIKPGISFGETDDYSYAVALDPVHVHDLQATILHCLGIDHTQLTYKFQGRHFRLTDIAGEVVNQIIV